MSSTDSRGSASLALDEGFRRLLAGLTPSARLPARLDLSALTEALDDLCRRSLDVAVHAQVEWGACITLNDDGFGLVHQVAGWTEGVVPLDTPEAHVGYVGFAHVHLPDIVERRPYLGFSDRDFQSTLADGDCLSLVCNGPEVFALVRTSDCSRPRRAPDEDEAERWEQLYDEAIRQARRERASLPAAGRASSDALDRALWGVNRELCSRLGLAFYRGQRGQPLVRLFRPLPRAGEGVERR